MAELSQSDGQKMRAVYQAKTAVQTGVVLFLALVLALRVVTQPMLLASPEPGLMAICSGGNIVYVSMETGLPVETGGDGQFATDPCPFSGVTAFDLIAQPFPAGLATAHLMADAWPNLPAPSTAPAAHQNTARAPPA